MFNYRYQSRKRLQFDGVDEYLNKDSPTGFVGDSAGSLSFWFVSDVSLAASSAMVLMGYGDDTASNGGRVTITVRRHPGFSDSTKTYVEILSREQGFSGSPSVFASAGTTTPIVTGTLYHVVFTASGSTYVIYVNGVAQTIESFNSSPNNGVWFAGAGCTGNTKFLVGNSYFQGGFASSLFNGKMDDISIWDKVLSAGEVTELYAAGKPKDCYSVSFVGSMRAYWKMGEGGENGNISTIYDLKGGANNLTSINMENGDIVNVQY